MADVVFNLTEIFEQICKERGCTIEEIEKLNDYLNSDKGKAELDK